VTAAGLPRRLSRANDGVAALEFALTAPILLLIIFATLQMAQAYYAQTVVTGMINAAGRASTLQTSQTSYASIDSQVASRIKAVVPWATVTFTRKNYADFTDVGRPEDYTDSNHNGVHDATECFADLNGNGTYDTDVGSTGLGGANDVVLYTVKVTYKNMFGYAHFLGLPANQLITASTVLRNQPYAIQTTRSASQVCP
jgi:Flp pilus assembly protein TadG